MTITTDTTLLRPASSGGAAVLAGVFRAADCRHVADETPDGAELETARRLGQRCPISRVEMSLEARLTQLIIKPQKTGGDFKEIDLLGRQIERLARVNRYSQTGNEADLNPNVANRNKGGRRKPKKNFSVTKPSKSWSRFSLSSLSTISCTGIAPGLSTASAIS